MAQVEITGYSDANAGYSRIFPGLTKVEITTASRAKVELTVDHSPG